MEARTRLLVTGTTLANPRLPNRCRASASSSTVVPKDFDTIEVGFEEAGGPRLVKGGAVHRRSQTQPAEEAVPVAEEGGA